MLRHSEALRCNGVPAVLVRSIDNLRVLGNHRFSKTVIHVGANDI